MEIHSNSPKLYYGFKWMLNFPLFVQLMDLQPAVIGIWGGGGGGGGGAAAP